MTFLIVSYHPSTLSTNMQMQMRLLCPSPDRMVSTLCQPNCTLLSAFKKPKFCTSRKIIAMAKNDTSDGIAEKAGIATGLVSNPVIAWSLFTLKTTGCGLPPGPGGSIGALEGVSYLAVVGIIGWSLYTKSKTGSGLPSGPFGLLGAVEGLSYLSLLAIIVVFGLQFLQQGSIPGPLPTEQCFG